MPNKALKIAKDLREISLANIFNDSDPSIQWYYHCLTLVVIGFSVWIRV